MTAPTAFIGPHRLYLGCAYQIRPSLGWFDCDCMDPPYLFNAVGAGQMRKARVATGMILAEDLHKGFDHAIINPLTCGAAIVFCHNDQIPEVSRYLKGNFKRFILGGWSKTNPLPVANKHYLYDTDYYVHAWGQGYEPQGTIAEKRRFTPAPVAPAKVYNHPRASSPGQSIQSPHRQARCRDEQDHGQHRRADRVRSLHGHRQHRRRRHPRGQNLHRHRTQPRPLPNRNQPHLSGLSGAEPMTDNPPIGISIHPKYAARYLMPDWSMPSFYAHEREEIEMLVSLFEVAHPGTLHDVEMWNGNEWVKLEDRA